MSIEYKSFKYNRNYDKSVQKFNRLSCLLTLTIISNICSICQMSYFRSRNNAQSRPSNNIQMIQPPFVQVEVADPEYIVYTD